MCEEYTLDRDLWYEPPTPSSRYIKNIYISNIIMAWRSHMMIWKLPTLRVFLVVVEFRAL